MEFGVEEAKEFIPIHGEMMAKRPSTGQYERKFRIRLGSGRRVWVWEHEYLYRARVCRDWLAEHGEKEG